jgi:hypothetical protein
MKICIHSLWRIGGFYDLHFFLDETEGGGYIFRLRSSKPPAQTHGAAQLIADG